tara:strand:+ start:5035 stop:7197 length:2163 start_codon:yes stop_codon:yes gene_type:complete
MNNYTKLFIDNKEIDLYSAEDLPLNITKRINTVEGKTQGDFSRVSVKVPATKNNINILGKTKIYRPFRIEVDGAPSFSGTAQIKKAKTFSFGYEAQEENFELNLISNNSSWFVLLGNTLLSELTDVVKTFNSTNILAGFVSSPSSQEFAFLLIKFKEWANSTGTAPNIQYQPSIYESTPALFIKPLIVQAFKNIGYTINSVFFDTDLFSKLVLPLPFPEKMPRGYNDEFLNTFVSLSAPYSVTGLTNMPFDTIDTAAPQNPTAYDNITNYEYTAPLTGYYECSISLEFAAAVPPGTFFFIIYLFQNGTPVVPNVGFAFSHIAPAYPAAGQNLTASGVVYASAGDVLTWNLSGSNVQIISGNASFIGEAVPGPGFEIDFKFLLRDWAFLDMLKGLKAMFNLDFQTDEFSKVVTIEPKDTYKETARYPATVDQKTEGFYKTSIQKDYSKIIDYNKEGSFEFPALPGVYDFQYKADSFETTIEFVEGSNPLKIYQSKYQILTGADLTKTEKIEVPFFVKTIHVLDHLAKYPNTNTVPQFPLIYSQNYILDPTATTGPKAEEISPRILYFAGQRTGGSWADNDGTIELFEYLGSPAAVPVAFMVNYNDSSGLDPNIGFDTQTINGIESPGLLQNFYLQQMTRNDTGEIRNNYIKFNSLDFINFSFREKAYIDSKKYIVQQITGFNPLKDSPTKFTFYVDVAPGTENLNNIENSLLSSVVSLLTS